MALEITWSDANEAASNVEGWAFLGKGSKSKRWLHHFESHFENTAEMHGYIVERGLQGSPLHIKVLAMLYAYNKGEFLEVMKGAPANKTGALVKAIALMARMAGATTGEM